MYLKLLHYIKSNICIFHESFNMYLIFPSLEVLSFYRETHISYLDNSLSLFKSAISLPSFRCCRFKIYGDSQEISFYLPHKAEKDESEDYNLTNPASNSGLKDSYVNN